MEEVISDTEILEKIHVKEFILTLLWDYNFTSFSAFFEDLVKTLRNFKHFIGDCKSKTPSKRNRMQVPP